MYIPFLFFKSSEVAINSGGSVKTRLTKRVAERDCESIKCIDGRQRVLLILVVVEAAARKTMLVALLNVERETPRKIMNLERERRRDERASEINVQIMREMLSLEQPRLDLRLGAQVKSADFARLAYNAKHNDALGALQIADIDFERTQL